MIEDDFMITSEQQTSLNIVCQHLGPIYAKNSYCTPYNVLRWVQIYNDEHKLAAKKLKRHLVVRKIRQLDSDVFSKGIINFATHAPKLSFQHTTVCE